MPRAIEVNPGKWDAEKRYLFDNDAYSVISGRYEGEISLGERWNGNSEDQGFPSQGGNPLWHVIPPFLALPILYGLIAEIIRRPYPGSEEHLNNIILELRRF
jgi:hypothetical protein